MRVPDLQRRVERACIELVDEGRQLTVGEVAARARVGKATIYRRPELRALVEEHRARGREALTLTGLAVQVDQLRQSLEAVAAKVRRHEEFLRRIGRRSRSSA
jgi:AcrR family transcriptional regulator